MADVREYDDRSVLIVTKRLKPGDDWHAMAVSITEYMIEWAEQKGGKHPRIYDDMIVEAEVKDIFREGNSPYKMLIVKGTVPHHQQNESPDASFVTSEEIKFLLGQS